MWLGTQTPALAQADAGTAASSPKAPIVLDGRELFYVEGLAGFTANERATFANQVLRDQLQRIPVDRSIRVWVAPRNSLITLRVAGRHLLTLIDQDLVGGISAEEQSDLWVAQLQEALDRAQLERMPAYRRQASRRILVIGLGVAIASILIRWLQRWLRRGKTLTPDWRRLWLETGLFLVQLGGWLGFLFWAAGRFPLVRSGRYQVLKFLGDTFTTTIVTIGGQDYSVLELAKILALMVGLWLVVRTLTKIIRSRVLQAMGAGRDVQDAIALIIQIILVTLGFLILLQAVGIDISSLTILVSLIGVGVGFGLQNIANNFISGLIILLERPIQVGDFVKLEDLTGTVEHIGIRSTEICTLDRVTIIVPNSAFIDSKVINWSHGYPVSRLHIPLGVAYGSAIQQVRQAVLNAVKCHPQVLRYPKPQLWFEGFGDSSLDFNLLVWIREPRLQFRIRSDLYYLLEANLRHYQIEIPFPQRDIHIRTSEAAAVTQPTAHHQDELAQDGAIASTALPEKPPDFADVMDWADILDISDEPTAAEVQELVSQMRSPEGVDIRDRRFGIRLFRHCFVGSDAVQWFMRQQLASREEAVRLGQILVERGIIHHVTDEHPFKDAYLFYRFLVDEAATDTDNRTTSTNVS